MVSMDMRPEFIPNMMLTPKMTLSIHVLQLNLMDLRTFMQAELEANPLLEEELKDSEAGDKEKNELDEEFSMLMDENLGDAVSKSVEDGVYRDSEEKRAYIRSLITQKESFYDHLHWQLEVLARNKEEKRIGEFIIGSLDENGFLSMDIEEMQKAAKTDNKRFKQVLRLVRSFDPVGVGARNLQESLLIQLTLSGNTDKYVYRIVYKHLEDLEKGNYEKIARIFSITPDDVVRIKKRIAYLNPRPAAAFGGEDAVYIEPDVFMDKNNGSYYVEVNEYDLPRITVSRYYKSILRDKQAPEATIDYIKKKLLNARWLISAIKQRKRTVGRVCGYLAETQKDFLDKGEEAVRPLTLGQVAGALSISEATVSRVVSNKYAHAWNAILPLKSFFSGGVETFDGKLISAKSVKLRIKKLIESEGCTGCLSDNRIAEILKEEGINIARRTVAKYRKGLGILPLYLRRENS